MPKLFTISGFSGVAPKIDPHMLGPSMAQNAVNCKFVGKTLSSWNESLAVRIGFIVNDVCTIYRFGRDTVSDTDYWFHWTTAVDVVKGSIADDQLERTYFVHPTLGARFTYLNAALTSGSGDYPYNSYPLGIPAPSAFTATLQIAGTGNQQELFYCRTYVTSLGNEGPPSDPTPAVTVGSSGFRVGLSGLGNTAPAGYAGFITAQRIYRTLDGNSATAFQLVDEIPIAQSTYSDNKLGTALGEVIPSLTWLPPPSGITGMIQMSNGIMVLFKGYDVYPSEAYIPDAYPIAYSQPTDYPIVGGCALGNSAVILTTGTPYLLTGTDPSAMTLDKLASTQACASKRSIAAGFGGCIFASPDGLIFISPGGQETNLTAEFFSREEWQKLNPSSMHGYFWDGHYFGFYNNGNEKRGFIFTPSDGAGAFVWNDTWASAGYVDLIQDALFLKVDDPFFWGGTIVKWNAGSAKLTKTWKSAIYEMANLMNPACAQVLANGYPQTVNFYGDGQLKLSKTVTSSDPFWLPSGYRVRYVEVEVIGDKDILAIHVATDIRSLRDA